MRKSSKDLLGSYKCVYDRIDKDNARLYVFYGKDDGSEGYPKIGSTMQHQLGLYSNSHIQVHLISGPEALPSYLSGRKPVSLSFRYSRFKEAKLRWVLENTRISMLDDGRIGCFIPAEQTSFDGMGSEDRQEEERRSLQRALRQDETNRMVRREIASILGLSSARKNLFVERTYEPGDELPSSYVPLYEYSQKNLTAGQEKEAPHVKEDTPFEAEQSRATEEDLQQEEKAGGTSGTETENEEEHDDDFSPSGDGQDEELGGEEPENEDAYDGYDESELFGDEEPADDEEQDYDESELFKEDNAETKETPGGQEEPEAEEESRGQEEESRGQEEAEDRQEESAGKASEEEQHEEELHDEEPEPEEEPVTEQDQEKTAGHEDGPDLPEGVSYDRAARTLTFDTDISRSLVRQVMTALHADGAVADTLVIGANCSEIHSDAFISEDKKGAVPGLVDFSSLVVRDREKPLEQTGPWADGLPHLGIARIECGNSGIGSFTLEKGNFRLCSFENKDFEKIPARFMAGNLQEDLCITSAAQIREIGEDAFNRIYDRTVKMTNSKGEKRDYQMTELGSKNKDFHVWKIPEYNNMKRMFKNLKKEQEENMALERAGEIAALVAARDIVAGKIPEDQKAGLLPHFNVLFDVAKVLAEEPRLYDMAERLAMGDVDLSMNVVREAKAALFRPLDDLSVRTHNKEFLDRLETVCSRLDLDNAGVTLAAAGWAEEDKNLYRKNAELHEDLESSREDRMNRIKDLAKVEEQIKTAEPDLLKHLKDEEKELRSKIDELDSKIQELKTELEPYRLFDNLKEKRKEKGIQVSWDVSKCLFGARSMMNQKTAFNRVDGIGKEEEVVDRLIENCGLLDAVFAREIKELNAKRAEISVAPDMNEKERKKQLEKFDSYIKKAENRKEELPNLRDYLQEHKSLDGYEDKRDMVDLVSNMIFNCEGIGDLAFAFGKGPSVVEDAEKIKLYQQGKIDMEMERIDGEISDLEQQVDSDKVSLSRIPPSKQTLKDITSLDTRLSRLTGERLLAEELVAARAEQDPKKREELLEALRGRVEEVQAFHARDKNRPETVLDRIVHENKAFAEMVSADKGYLGLFAEIVGKINGGADFSTLQGDLGKLEALRTASEVSHAMDTSGLSDISKICRAPKTKEDILNAWPELNSHISRIYRYSDEIEGMAKYNNAYAKNAFARTVASNHKTAAEPDPKPKTAIDFLLEGDPVKLQEWKDRISTDQARHDVLEKNLREAERLEKEIGEAEEKISNLKETKIALDQKRQKVDGRVLFGMGTHSFNYDPDAKKLYIDRQDGLSEGACYRYRRKETKDGKVNPFVSNHVATGCMCEDGRYNGTCAYTELPGKKHKFPAEFIVLNGTRTLSNLGRMAYGMLGGAVVSIFMPTRQILRQNIINIFKSPFVIANGLTGGIPGRLMNRMVRRCMELGIPLSQRRDRNGNVTYKITPENFMKLSFAAHREKKAGKEEKKSNTSFEKQADKRLGSERRARERGESPLNLSVANGPGPKKEKDMGMDSMAG